MKEGWEYKKLGEVCDFQGGSQPPKSEWSKEPRDGYVRMLQIRDFTQNATNYIEYVKKSKSLKYCNDDDILIGRYGASVGKILTGLSGAYNVAIIKTIPQEIVNKHYLKYYFLSPYFQHNLLATSQHRAAQAGFSKEDIFDYKILCPSLSEQQHIVEELDLLSSIIEKKKAQLNELNNLAQSLYYEMFGDPITNEKGWEVKKLGEICSFSQGVQVDVSEQSTEKIPGWNRFLRIVDYTTDNDDIRYVNVNDPKFILNKDDIAMVRYGASVGTSDIGKEGVLANNLFKINYSKYVFNKYYLLYSFHTKYFKAFINTVSFGAAMPALSFKVIKDFQILQPPLSCQQSFATKIETIEHQKELIKQSIKEVETLFNSRMDYYFN